MTALLPPARGDADLELVVPTRLQTPGPTTAPKFKWENVPIFLSAYTPEEAYQAHEAVRQVFNATVAQCAVDGLKVIGSHEAWRNTFGMTSSLPTLYDLMVETGWRKQGSESYRAEVRRNLAMMLRETAMVQADLSRVRFGIRNSSHLIVDSGPNYEKADAMIRITENVFAGVARFFHSSSTNTFLVSDPHGFIFLHALKANVKALGFWEVLAEEADLAGDEESSLVRL